MVEVIQRLDNRLTLWCIFVKNRSKKKSNNESQMDFEMLREVGNERSSRKKFVRAINKLHEKLASVVSIVN